MSNNNYLGTSDKKEVGTSRVNAAKRRMMQIVKFLPLLIFVLLYDKIGAKSILAYIIFWAIVTIVVMMRNKHLWIPQVQAATHQIIALYRTAKLQKKHETKCNDKMDEFRNKRHTHK